MAEDSKNPLAWTNFTRREIIMLLCGAALSFGATRIPGITIEPEELSTCKTALAVSEAKVEHHDAQIKSLTARVSRCWERFRDVGREPMFELSPEATLDLTPLSGSDDLWGTRGGVDDPPQ